MDGSNLYSINVMRLEIQTETVHHSEFKPKQLPVCFEFLSNELPLPLEIQTDIGFWFWLWTFSGISEIKLSLKGANKVSVSSEHHCVMNYTITLKGIKSTCRRLSKV